MQGLLLLEGAWQSTHSLGTIRRLIAIRSMLALSPCMLEATCACIALAINLRKFS